MILFIIIAIGIFIYTIFAKEFLLDSIKNLDKYNKEIKEKIRHNYTNYNSFTFRKYNKNDYSSIPKIVLEWLLCNVIFNCVNAIIVIIISILVVYTYPKTETQYSFNINSLGNNLINKEIYSSTFFTIGSIDGEIGYFFLRTINEKEKIGYIPAKDTYIKYDNESEPHIEVHQIVHNFPKWLQKILWVEVCNSTIVEYYIIIIPKGISTIET